MNVFSLKARITASGQLEVELPYGLPSGDARVTLEVPVRSENSAEVCSADGPPYRSLRGIWAGKLADTDVDTDLAEMNRQWQKSLDLLE